MRQQQTRERKPPSPSQAPLRGISSPDVDLTKTTTERMREYLRQAGLTASDCDAGRQPG
jgi:hypothetical protein